ncbi:unnamed protein product [Owenia fusiformis]|uniref:Uncharacterized protein n=1 Tax=Owenia fusiformis TaxID=6347 RepID=A0A8J1Y9Z4_OWEFU|nr:unnamed protein product [Owenia fusiformis]
MALIGWNSVRGIAKHLSRNRSAVCSTCITCKPALQSKLQSVYILQTASMSGSTNDTLYTKEVKGFLDDLYKLVMDEAMVKGTDRAEKVVDFKHPEELKALLGLSIGETGATNEELLEACRKAIKYSVHTGHPLFINQLYCGGDPYGIAGSWVVEALNTNQHTYEVAPAFILTEAFIVEKMKSFVGYKGGDGIFSPGGSLANMFGIHLARFSHEESLNSTGLFNSKRLMLFTSDEAHYSTSKGSSFMGFGRDSVVSIKTDSQGRMMASDLEEKVNECIAKDCIPLCVVATCGTTVLGAYDDLNAIADVCEKHKMWMHIDAAWGGSALLSKTHRSLMSGVERSDSILWNAHKMMNAQVQCSMFLVKEKGLLERCNCGNATYLFQQDKFYDVSYDTGDKTVQCGRKAEAFKLYLMWKAKGDKGFEMQIDKAFDNARYLTEKVRATEGFRPVLPEFQCTNISFWYIPPSLRGQEETPEWWDKISKVAPKIKERMVMKGNMMIGYQPLKYRNMVNFFRVIIQSPALNYKDMDFIVEEIDRLGQDL